MRATAEATRAKLTNDTAFASLMDKHRENLTLATGRKVTDEAVLAAIRQTDDREQMRELLQKRQKIHEEIWRLQFRLGDRHREVEKTDAELRQSNHSLKDLRKDLQQKVLASDPELQRLEAGITEQQQQITTLLGKRQ
jgi:peptidoglycan hydrolase CwlO-like protein